MSASAVAQFIGFLTSASAFLTSALDAHEAETKTPRKIANTIVFNFFIFLSNLLFFVTIRGQHEKNL